MAQKHLGQLILTDATAGPNFGGSWERARAAAAELAAAEARLADSRVRQRTLNRSLGLNVRWLMAGVATFAVCLLVGLASRTTWSQRTTNESAAKPVPLGGGASGPTPTPGNSGMVAASPSAVAPAAVETKRWTLGPGMSVELPVEWDVSLAGAGDRWVEIRSGPTRLAFTAGPAGTRPEPGAAIPAHVEDLWANYAKDKREVTTTEAVYERGEHPPATVVLRGRLKLHDVTRVRLSRVWFWGQGDEATLVGLIARVSAGLRSDGVLATRDATEAELFETRAGKGFSLLLPKEGLTTCETEGDAVVVYFDDPEGAGYACLAFAVLGADDEVAPGDLGILQGQPRPRAPRLGRPPAGTVSGGMAAGRVTRQGGPRHGVRATHAAA